MRKFMCFAAAAALVLVMGTPTASLAGAPLQGTWKKVEASYTSPDTSWTRSDFQPELLIIAKTHYSWSGVLGIEPRALYVDWNKPTDEEKLAAYDSFFANCGTYEAKDGRLTIRPTIARVPNFMAGEQATYEYQIDGDTLLLTNKGGPWDPDAKYEWRGRFVRVK